MQRRAAGDLQSVGAERSRQVSASRGRRLSVQGGVERWVAGDCTGVQGRQQSMAGAVDGVGGWQRQVDNGVFGQEAGVGGSREQQLGQGVLLDYAAVGRISRVG